MGAKLGIIFAFLLSFAAAGGSYYLYQGWVEERTVRGTVEAENVQVKEKMDAVQAEKKQIEVKSEEYRTKAEAMQSQLAKLQTEQSRIDSEKTALESKLKEHQGMIAELQKQVGELAKKAQDAQAACGVTPADMKTDPFAASATQPFDGASNAPAATPAASASGTGNATLVFKPATPVGVVTSGISPATASSAMLPAVAEKASSAAPAGAPTQTGSARETAQLAPVSTPGAVVSGAKVLTVNRKFNFVVINQGLQDGLKMGEKLRVLKQGKEVATLQVEKLYDKFSAATLMEEDPKRQVVEGDEVQKT